MKGKDLKQFYYITLKHQFLLLFDIFEITCYSFKVMGSNLLSQIAVKDFPQLF